MIQRQFLSDIIRTRCEDILEAVDQLLHTNGLGSARTYNLALTGGASQLTGISDFVSEFWNKPVALRPPTPLSGPDGQISVGLFLPVWALPVSFNLLKTSSDRRQAQAFLEQACLVVLAVGSRRIYNA